MKKLQISKRTRNDVFAFIDDDEFDRVSQYSWSLMKGKSGIFYAKSQINGKFTYLHRFIINAPKGVIVDRVNRNGLDNRKSNLRLSNLQQNAFNSKIFSHNTSGYKGVYWDKDRNKWCAQIMVNQKTIHLGRTINLQDAVFLRKQAEAMYL